MERAERSGGLHKRSAEDWGNGLRARGAELPLAALACEKDSLPKLMIVGSLSAEMRVDTLKSVHGEMCIKWICLPALRSHQGS